MCCAGAALVDTASVATSDDATTDIPKPINPASMVWRSVPNNSALRVAWVLGAEQQPGPYLLRVQLASGGKIPPHTHPDVRNSTVLSGTLYVGFGATFDAAKTVAITTGGVYVAPANVPHYLWAKDGDVMYQESGVAPTATIPAPRLNEHPSQQR